MHGHKLTGTLFVCIAMSLSGCQSSPKPCDCGLAEKELRHYAQGYFHEIAENGVLRQQVKACQEKNP